MGKEWARGRTGRVCVESSGTRIPIPVPLPFSLPYCPWTCTNKMAGSELRGSEGLWDCPPPCRIQHKLHGHSYICRIALIRIGLLYSVLPLHKMGLIILVQAVVGKNYSCTRSTLCYQVLGAASCFFK